MIIADSRRDLFGAALEGLVVAGAVGASASASQRVTRDRLWAARDAELLHLAGHADLHGHQRALRLADGDVDSGELIRRRIAPRLAVLATCGSAASQDEEGWGSIAAALLEAGTATAIATDRSVRDAAALTIMRAFYAAAGLAGGSSAGAGPGTVGAGGARVLRGRSGGAAGGLGGVHGAAAAPGDPAAPDLSRLP